MTDILAIPFVAVGIALGGVLVTFAWIGLWVLVFCMVPMWAEDWIRARVQEARNR